MMIRRRRGEREGKRNEKKKVRVLRTISLRLDTSRCFCRAIKCVEMERTKPPSSARVMGFFKKEKKKGDMTPPKDEMIL